MEKLIVFLSLPLQKVMAVDIDGNLIISDKFTTRTKLGESVDLIENVSISDMYVTERDFSFVHIIESDDIMEVSNLNKIPLKRLVYDFEDIRDLNQEYIQKLNNTYNEMLECIEFLSVHGFTSKIVKNDDLNEIIREFIKKELLDEPD